MKTTRPWIATVLAIALCAATAGAAETPAAPAKQAPAVTKAAQEAIQQMLKAYGDLKQYRATFTVTTTVQTGKMKRSTSVTGDVDYVRPNEVHVRVASGDQHFSITCNGKQCLARYTGSGKYLLWKAPSNLDSVLGNPSLVQVLQDMVRVTLIPFTGDPYKNFMIGVSSAKLAPQEAGKPILLQMDVSSGKLDVYIDPKTHLVTEAHALPTRMIEALKAQEPNMGDVTVTHDLKQTVLPADKPMPADAFSVAPPKDAPEASGWVDLFQLPALKEMADFTLPSLTEGKTVKLSDYKGKVILLDFWATWCPPCRAELPILAGINKEFADKGLVFFAVNQAEKRQKVEDFLKQQKLDIPVLLDTDAKVGDLYRVSGLPTLYLFGKDGKTVKHFEGLGPNLKDELETAITKALAAPEPKS